MGRKKGSKNKNRQPVEEQILTVNAEIEELSSRIAEKKAELKNLRRQREDEVRNRILEAVEKSDKSYDEIMEFLLGDEEKEEETEEKTEEEG